MFFLKKIIHCHIKYKIGYIFIIISFYIIYHNYYIINSVNKEFIWKSHTSYHKLLYFLKNS